ncbi:MAG: YceD family protein [Gammaproteobacteria bacterium]|nr:YceD family protein [Gammaproteobacteria bacterium]
MGNPLRDRRTPAELAACGQVIDFKDKITDFVRLATIVKADLDALDPAKIRPDWRDAEVCGRLVFGFSDAQFGLRAERPWPTLKGTVTTTIDAVCQRCLEPFRLPLIADLRLLFTTDAAMSVADGGCEVWELEQDTLRPLDLVDEALVMALPFAAMHVDDATCQGPDVLEEESRARIRPFAGLRSQMEQDD